MNNKVSAMNPLDARIVNAGASAMEVFVKLLREDIVCVCDGGRLIGVVTPADLQRALASMTPSGGGTAAEICNARFSSARLSSLEEDLILYAPIKRLPLLDDDGNLIYVYHNETFDVSWRNAQRFEIGYWQMEAKQGNIGRTAPPPDVFSSCFYLDGAAVCTLSHSFEGRVALEIGAGPRMGYMPGMAGAKRRIIIEPLADEYAKLREKYNIAIPNAEDIEIYPCGGDVYIETLKGKADGLIICQNALDHTPSWPFVLNNIGLYASPGCLLYLWTDIDHGKAFIEGHYNITPNPDRLIRFVESMGFVIEHSRVYSPIHNLSVCIVARKL